MIDTDQWNKWSKPKSRCPWKFCHPFFSPLQTCLVWTWILKYLNLSSIEYICACTKCLYDIHVVESNNYSGTCSVEYGDN